MSYKRILAGTDGSPGSLEAVKLAATLAKAAGAELTIASAYQRPDQSLVEAIWEAGKVGRAEIPDELQWRVSAGGSAQASVEEAAAAAAASGVEARTRIEEGRAAETLIRIADEEQADLIVVGNRGMHGAARFLLGSTPDKISHYAPCDLMIVAGPDS